MYVSARACVCNSVCDPGFVTLILSLFSIDNYQSAGWFTLLYVLCLLMFYVTSSRERSGSVVECLTRDRRAAGSSLTGVTALCP